MCVFVLKKFNEPYTGYLPSDRVSTKANELLLSVNMLWWRLETYWFLFYLQTEITCLNTIKITLKCICIFLFKDRTFIHGNRDSIFYTFLVILSICKIVCHGALNMLVEIDTHQYNILTEKKIKSPFISIPINWPCIRYTNKIVFSLRSEKHKNIFYNIVILKV
jgi:hypothetical protein